MNTTEPETAQLLVINCKNKEIQIKNEDIFALHNIFVVAVEMLS